MKNLDCTHYDCVEDILEEALSTLCGIDVYYINGLEKDVEYVVGTINIVKLGDNPNTLKFKQNNKWSEDVTVSASYEYATYFRLDKINELIKKHLSRKFYNNEFLNMEN